MSSRFALVQPDGSTYTIDHRGGPDAIGGHRRSVSLEQAPNSERAWLDGDNTRLLEPITFTWTIKTSGEIYTHAEIDTIISLAETASSIKRVVDGVNVSWRALQGLQVDQISKPGQSTKTMRLALTFLPVHPLWTTTRAETQGDYDAATKRRYA